MFIQIIINITSNLLINAIVFSPRTRTDLKLSCHINLNTEKNVELQTKNIFCDVILSIIPSILCYQRKYY